MAQRAGGCTSQLEKGMIESLRSRLDDVSDRAHADGAVVMNDRCETAGRPRPVELTDRDYQALAQIRHALRRFLRFSEEAARREGLTPNQQQLLLAIRGFASGREPTIGDVAELLQLQHHSVVELVGRAVETGLVRRHVDVGDRRRQRLAVTAEGNRKLARLTPAHQAELLRFRDQMSTLLNGLG